MFNKQMLYYEYPLDTFFRFNGQMMCTFYIVIDVFVLELSVHGVYQQSFCIQRPYFKYAARYAMNEIPVG